MKPEIVRAHNMFRVPVWMTDHRPEWIADNRPVWMTDHRPDWEADEVPKDIARVLAEQAEGGK
jgi:hypothetical protein